MIANSFIYIYIYIFDLVFGYNPFIWKILLGKLCFSLIPLFSPATVGGWWCKGVVGGMGLICTHSNIPADTGRFAAWIQDILSGMPAYSGCKISGHSAKSTPLSWVAKNFTDMDVQTILGHHVLVGRGSALTYARDTQAAPVRKMEEVLTDIRRGIFLPDATRSGRHITGVPGPAAPDMSPAGGFSQFHVEPHDQLLEGAELGVNSSQGDAAGGIGNDFDDGLQVSDVDDLLNEAREVASRQAHSPISSRGPELWPEEREWYKAALDNGSEPGSASDALAQPNRLAGDGCEKANAEDSSSSSDSSSEASVEEQVQACGDHADDLEHQKIGECKLFRHKGTRMVHLLPAGSSTNRFVGPGSTRNLCEIGWPPSSVVGCDAAGDQPLGVRAALRSAGT